MRWKTVRRQLRSKRSLLLKLSFLVPAVLILAYSVITFFQNSDRNFSRGVLAINTDKSIYAPDEAVLFQMASLDKNGDTLCNSNLQVEIRKAWRWKKTIINTEQGQIQQLPSCSPDNNVTNEPDYIARYTVSIPGTYRLTLKNLDSGKRVKTTFQVKEEQQPVNITRSGATRINPSKSDRYPMILRVTANQDFKGTLVESVPKDFQFKWYGGAKVIETDKNQQLSWEVDLKAGETKEYTYEYTAPQKSPDFIRFGLAKLTLEDVKSSEETRPWQMAVTQ